MCYISHQVVCISYHVNQEPHMVYCIYANRCTECHYVHQKLHLGVLHLPSSVLQRPSSNIKNNTGVHFRSLTGLLHLPSSGLHILSYKSGASHGVLKMPTGVLNIPSCTSEASLGVYCICHQVYCRGHHLTSGTTLGCSSGASRERTAFAIHCTAEAII